VTTLRLMICSQSHSEVEECACIVLAMFSIKGLPG
jgi:hypothetical protein